MTGTELNSSPNPQSALSAPFNALLFEAAALGQQVRNRGRNLNDSGTSGVAISLMEVLMEGGPQTVPQLARAGATSRQNIQVQVNRMLKAGLLELRTNPAHCKSPLVALSVQGQLALTTRMAEMQQQWRVELNGISDPEIASALEVLRKIRTKLQKPSRIPSLKRQRAGRVTGPHVAAETLENEEVVALRPAVPADERNYDPQDEDMPLSLL